MPWNVCGRERVFRTLSESMSRLSKPKGAGGHNFGIGSEPRPRAHDCSLLSELAAGSCGTMAIE
eukprot:14030611-Alexandrium_andersonii.AAC.1